MSFSEQYLSETVGIAMQIPPEALDDLAVKLALVRDTGGRLFFLGVGGGAGHASHAVNDFRKLCGIESYTPSDNVSELTARANDEGWDTTYVEWLNGSKLNSRDAVFVFSVGGGSIVPPVSLNIAAAVSYAKNVVGASVYGIVGRDGGETARFGDEVIIIPAPEERVTPHVEGFQAVLWHLLVTHPLLATNEAKWEGLTQ